MNRLYFDCEEDQWKFQPLVPAGGCVRTRARAGDITGLGTAVPPSMGTWRNEGGAQGTRVAIGSHPVLRELSAVSCCLMGVPLLISFSGTATK